MTEQEQRDSWKSLGIRTDIPHPARVYDYMLGGKDNFAADRETAERSLELVPEMLDSSRGNRDFLVRAIRFLRDAGIRQFLDIGTGLPTSPNTHETAQEGHPDARVVYVDNDPVVVVHAEALMADNATTAVVSADLRDVDEVMAKAGQLLDFTRPVALMFVAVLHCIPDRRPSPRGTWPRSRPAVTLSCPTPLTSSLRIGRIRPRPKLKRGAPPGSRGARTTSCACSTAGNSSIPVLCSSPTGGQMAVPPATMRTGPGPTAASR